MLYESAELGGHDEHDLGGVASFYRRWNAVAGAEPRGRCIQGISMVG